MDPSSVENAARRARQEYIMRSFAAIGRSIAAAVAGALRRRAVYRELAALPDHLLNDIGLRRDQLEAVAFGGLKREASDLALAAESGSIRFFEAKPAAPAPAKSAAQQAGSPLAA
jgi:uncharacterized protein YjiS (DUF1127 family)